jgi:hypothetical protein
MFVAFGLDDFGLCSQHMYESDIKKMVSGAFGCNSFICLWLGELCNEQCLA